MGISGLELCARYSYQPNLRGYCGPKDVHKKIYDYCTKGGSEKEISGILSRFEGLFPYLKFIGEKLGRGPFDIETVKAYWLGLGVRKIKTSDYAKMAKDSFKSEKEIPKEAHPSHNSHTLFLFPVVAKIERNLENIENCMIRLGKVKEVEGQNVIAKVKGVEDKTEVIGRGFADPKKGDYVSIHWGACVQVLGAKERIALEGDLKSNLRILRASLKKISV
jgi:hydrogenase maturation factor